MTVRTVPDAGRVEEGLSNFQSAAEDPMKPTLIVEQPDGYDVAIGVQKPSVIQKGGSQDGRGVIDAKLDAFEEVDLSVPLLSRQPPLR